MSSFTEPFEYKIVEPGVGELTKLIVFYKDDDMTGEFLTMPVGTRFNGASDLKWLKDGQAKKIFGKILKLMGWNPWDPHILPATVVHDCLVGEFGRKARVGPYNRTVSWNEAAKWFDEALRVCDMQYGNVSWLKRKLIISAVMAYGKATGKK